MPLETQDVQSSGVREHAGPAPGAAVLDVDFYADAALDDPLPVYRAILDAGPVAWLAPQGLHAVGRHAELSQVLRAHDVFISSKGIAVLPEINAKLNGNTLNSDPPVHEFRRGIVARPLTPKALEALRARVRAVADEVAERLSGQGAFDAAADLAPALPMAVVRDLVGLDVQGRDSMLEWGAATFDLIGDPRARREGSMASFAELRRFLEVEGRPDRLDPDGWAAGVFTAGAAQGLAEDACAEMMRDYIVPSLDTTISAVAKAAELFALHPEQWDRLRADRDLIPSAVEEIIRLASPIRAFTRHVATEAEVGGVRLPAGARVLVVFGAANRDPRAFPDPDRFDVTRNPRRHMGFGHGIHACMGMHLARLEVRELLAALADRVARWELAGPGRVARNSTIHAFAELPVRVERAV